MTPRTAFAPLPAIAAWRHRDAREGFETVRFVVAGPDVRLEGHTAAVEAGEAWSVRYDITLGDGWATRSARVWGIAADGAREVHLEADGPGRWLVDGGRRPDLDGCFDVDLESSACTNTMPVHRLALSVGDAADAPATYVRALDLTVERLEQRYVRLEDDASGRQVYDYSAAVFDFRGRLLYDASGLVVDYPGIAVRVR